MIFYPSLVCNLRIRFDEAFHVTEQTSPTTTTDDANPSMFGPLAGGIQKVTRPLVIEQPIEEPLFAGEKLSKPDQLSVITNRIPKTASVELPAYIQAGKFSMTFDYRDLPIDPRVVRSCGVEIYLGTVSPTDFGTGMTTVEQDGTRKSILQPLDDDGKPRSDVVLLIGNVDNWTVTHTSRGSEATIEGRDNRGLLLDSPLAPQLFTKLDLKKPIASDSANDNSGVINQILRKHPAGKKINIVVNVDDWPDSKVPSPYTKDTAVRTLQGVNGDDAKGKPSGNVDNVSYWSLIVNYCTLVGAVPFFVGEKIHVRPSRSIFDQAKKAGIDPHIKTPFKGGEQREAKEGKSKKKYSVRRMVYGRDVEELSFERKYTGVKRPTIECVSIDTSHPNRGRNKDGLPQRLLQERFPPKTQGKGNKKTKIIADPASAHNTSVSPSGQATEEVLRISCPGIKDRKRLRQRAEDLYHQIGRQEMGGSFKTKNLTSFLIPDDPNDKIAWNADPDLTHLRPGDGVELLIDSRALEDNAPAVSTYIDQFRNQKEFENDLRKRFGKGSAGIEDIARVILAVTSNSVIELAPFFRVSNVKYDWAVASGISIAADFQNFVEVRGDVSESSGENMANPTVSTT